MPLTRRSFVRDSVAAVALARGAGLASIRAGTPDTSASRMGSANLAGRGLTAVPVGRTTAANAFPHWRRALANVRAGLGSAKLLCLGDSTTWGIDGGGHNPPGPAGSSWPSILQSMLNNYHVPASIGLAIPPSGIGAPDSRWTVQAGWTRAPFGIAGDCCFRGAVGAGTLSFRPGGDTDTYDIYFLGDYIGGTVQADVNGGGRIPIVTGNANGTYKITLSAKPGSNTVNLTGVTLFPVNIVGIEASLSSARTVRVGNAGASGSYSSGLADAGHTNPFYTKNLVAVYAPALTIIDCGINDAINGVTPAAYQVNLRTAITNAKDAGSDVIVTSVVPSTTPEIAAVEGAFADIARLLASSEDAGFVDLWTRSAAPRQLQHPRLLRRRGDPPVGRWLRRHRRRHLRHPHPDRLTRSIAIASTANGH